MHYYNIWKIIVDYFSLNFHTRSIYPPLLRNQRGLVCWSIIDGMYFDFIESLPLPEGLNVLGSESRFIAKFYSFVALKLHVYVQMSMMSRNINNWLYNHNIHTKFLCLLINKKIFYFTQTCLWDFDIIQYNFVAYYIVRFCSHTFI